MEEAHRKIVNAWCMYDWANSAFITTIGAAVLPTFFYSVAAAGLSEIQQSRATQIWGLATSIAAAIVAVLAVILGPIADYSASKKKFLAFFTGLGILASFFLVAVGQGAWVLCVFLYIMGRVGFSGGIVFYDALLPHVAREDEIDQVSSKGYALGYLGGGILLAVNIAMIMLAPKGDILGISWKEFMTRLTFATVGIWWLVFAVPLFRDVPEPPGARVEGPRINPLKAGFQRLGVTFHHLRQYRPVLMMLLAFWLYNDGISTIIDMATIYGTEVFIAKGVKDPTIHLITALLITQFVGIPFSLLFGALARRLGAKRSIYLALSIYILVCIGGFFMGEIWHFYALAVLVGFVQGGSQALSRSLYGSMTPRTKTAEFFGFFNIVGKFSAILGPALFALMGRMFGESRWSIISLIVFFVVGMILLSFVDVQKGVEAAQATTA